MICGWHFNILQGTRRIGKIFEAASWENFIFDKGLYALRSSGDRFHEHLSDTLTKMDFVPSKADLDLWLNDCRSHYEYIARYVDDILMFSKEPEELIKCLKLVPEYYLGGDFKICKFLNGVETFAFGAKTYSSNFCGRIEKLMGTTLKKFETPLASGDHLETDDTGLL